MAYYSTKTYGHNIGLSAVFRQPNAEHSHCHLLHGYSLAFTFTFGCNELDGVGAEKFAEHAFNFADKLIREATDNRCYCVRVECAEHGANSAIYEA